MSIPVVLSIEGKQSYLDQEPEIIELVTEGVMEQNGEVWSLSYEESDLTGLAGVTTTFQLQPGKESARMESGEVDPQIPHLLSFREKIAVGGSGSGQQKIPGVIGTKPIHHLSSEEKNQSVRMSALHVDIGAASKADAQTHVRRGDVIYFLPEYRTFGDGCIAAKALDDRFGCALLLSLIRQDLPYDTDFAFVVQEEVGLRGAGVAANTAAPEFAVVIEATTAADVAGCKGTDAVCQLGHGAVISFMDGRTIYDAELYQKAADTAQQLGIPWQTKTRIAGGNDAGAIQSAAGGVRVLAVSIPCRYLHSPVSVVKLSDAEACEQLAAALIPMIQNIGDSDDDC